MGEHFEHLPAVYIVVALNAFLHMFCLGGLLCLLFWGFFF